MLIPLLDLCHWQPNADSKPEAVAYGRTGTSFRLGTMEPADTCIGRALRGRQAPHALLALKGIGEKKADAILAEVGIEGDRHIASLGSNQAEQLIAAAAEHGAS